VAVVKMNNAAVLIPNCNGEKFIMETMRLLTERKESSLSYLTDGEDCLMYDTIQTFNKILVSNVDLSAIVESGYQKIANGKNFFSNRVSQLLEALQ
jgi:hypothetical protein